MRWMALLLLLLLTPLAARGDCPSVWPTGTFLQLYESDLERTSGDWEESLKRWKALGVEELVLQWSAYGSPDAGSFPLIESDVVVRLLTAAEATGIRLRVGLRYDPGFWQDYQHDGSSGRHEEIQAPTELSRYLFRRWQDQQALVAALAPLAVRPAFGGWYISDEIDDQRWRPAGRRQLLHAYLEKLVNLLRNHTPEASVAISAFSNGLLPPLELSEFLQELAVGSGIDLLLFQDGIGAEKLETSELATYIPALAERFAGSNQSFSVIVELFETSPGGEALSAAPMERIRQQLHQSAASRAAPATFALPHHADPAAGAAAARLADELAELKQRCGF